MSKDLGRLHTRRWAATALLCAWLLGLSVQPVAAAGSIASVRENLVYHVIRLARWPQSAFQTPRDRFAIAVFGSSQEGLNALFRARAEFLQAHPKRRPHGRGYALRFPSAEPSADSAKLRRAHVVYVADNARVNVPRLLKGIEGAPVLSVGETEGFLRAGGMVALIVERGRIRPHVNLAAVQAAGIEMGAELLRHAHIVGPRRGAGR